MNIQFKTKNFKPLTLSLALSLALTACATEKNSAPEKLALDNTITLSQVTNDVAYLASDELNGRGNFSTHIEQAAQYIAKRFNEVGLTSAEGTVKFQQFYQIKTITPTALSITLNGQPLADSAITVASTEDALSWDASTQGLNTKVISQEDNMRDVLRALNHQGGNHLVLLHSSHEKTFKRYQAYFSRGLTKLVTEENSPTGGAIVIALTDETTLDNFTITAQSQIKQHRISNVIGVLPGKSKADEIVLYSAHYDHLGGTFPHEFSESAEHTKNKGSHIYNGADDDASGVSAIINLADHFAKSQNNERTLMFAAFSAEEIGGFGSKYFSAQVNPNDITAMINIEMIGKPAKFGAGTLWMTGMERSSLGQQLNQTLLQHDKEIYADPYPKQNLFYRSDNATLARLGVPAHSFSSTQLDKDQHYHKVTDDIKSLDLNSMHEVIKTLAIATTPLVEGKITPSRIDANLVKGKGKIF